MSAQSLISREVITFTSLAEELTIPAGTNQIWIRKLSSDVSLTVEVNEQTATPEADAELYQMTVDESSLIDIPFYSEMTTLFLTSPENSTCIVEFRSR